MQNLHEGIALLRDAETIVASKLLSNEDKEALIGSLIANLPPPLSRPYVLTITAALERLYGTYAPAQARKAAGKQDAPSVAPGPGEGAEAPSPGPSEGKPEQAQDAGKLDSSSNRSPAPAEAPAQAERPKQGKARK